MYGCQLAYFVIVKQPRANQEANAHRYFERKTGSPTGRNIDRQVCVLPVLKLVFRHPEITAFDLPQPYVRRANDEIALLETHRRRAIAAATTLVKHQWPMLRPKFVDNGYGCRGSIYAGNRLRCHNRGGKGRKGIKGRRQGRCFNPFPPIRPLFPLPPL